MTYTFKSLMKLAKEYCDLKINEDMEFGYVEPKTRDEIIEINNFITWLHEKNKTVVKTSER